jgi:pimeloyl-ACP methyl ester carboxylesterase
MVGIVRAERGEGDEMALFGAMTAPCIAEIKASGIDLANFNTAENARDVRAVVSALGYGDYNIYGASYGTLLAQEVMRSVPEGVRSVVLDSVAPTDVPIWDTLAGPFDTATVAIFDQCAADPACAEAYPDLLPRFNALLEKLTAEPIPAARGKAAITADILFGMIDARNKVTTPAITGLFPKMIAELEKGETATFDRITAEGFGAVSLDATITGTRAGLAPDTAAMAEIALRLADQRRGLDAALDAAVTRLKAELQAARGGTTLPGTFDAALEAAILETTQGAQRAAFVRDYAALALVPPSRAALLDLVERHFLYRTRDRLAALIAAMSEAEVTAAFARVRSDTGPYEASFSGMFDLDIYFCQEFRPFNSLEGARAFNATLSVPEWGRQVEPTLEHIFGFCDAFAPQPREGFHEPVVSDLPVLVLSGLNDVQTSWTWGPHVAESLTNARAFVFPEAGHGALLFSQCAVDLGVAFVEDPGQALDASCIEDLRPEFELP